MSRVTKQKHVLMEVLQNDYTLPTEDQEIVRVLGSRGNNLHEVVNGSGEIYLISMPTKFRKNFWVKRGDFLLVEPITEGDRVKGEMVRILTDMHLKYFKKSGIWPEAFGGNNYNELQNDEDNFDNTNRKYELDDMEDEESTDDSEPESQSVGSLEI